MGGQTPVGVEEGEAVGPALKPRERSSGAARIAEADDVAQSAKAPESDASCLLVVATTEICIFIDVIICVEIKKEREREVEVEERRRRFGLLKKI